jgi:hypothetical protein
MTKPVILEDCRGGARQADWCSTGFARIEGALDRHAVEALGAALPLGGGGGDYGAIAHDVWRRTPAIRSIAAAAGLDDLARELLGTDVAIWFQDHLIDKSAPSVRPIEWHQDYSYWPIDRPLGLTMWVAIDGAGEDSGCLRYVPGSHRWGERRAAGFGAGDVPDRGLPPIDEARAEAAAVAAPTAAGDVLIHHPLTWHMSRPNHSGRLRRGYSITWLHPAARWAPDRCRHPLCITLSPAPGDPLDPGHFPRNR